MKELLNQFSIEELQSEIAERREKKKSERDAEMVRIGGELSKLVEAFEKATGWKLNDWRTWTKSK